MPPASLFFSRFFFRVRFAPRMMPAFALLLALMQPEPSWPQDLGDEIVAAVPANLPPQYLSDPKTGRPTGFAVDIMDEVARLSGLHIRYKIFDTWSNVHQAILDHRALIVPDLGITAEHVHDYDFTKPIETEHLRIFVRETNTDILGIESLFGRKVGVVEFNKGTFLMETRGHQNLMVFNSCEEALLALLSGNIEALVYAEDPVWVMARSAGLDHRIMTVGTPLLEIKRGIAVRKGNPELVQVLDEAVRMLIQSPKYRDIYAKWFKAPEPYWNVRRVATLMGGLLVFCVAGLLVWRYVSISRMNKSLRTLVSERERAEQALRKNQSQLNAIFQNVAAGIAVLNPAGQYLEINDKWAEMLGYAKEDIIGRSFGEMTFSDDLEKSLLRMNDLVENRGNNYRIEKRYLRKDGSVFWADLSVTRILDRAGKVEALIAVILDITDTKTIEEQLQNANDKLESFVYTLSHDLRSPLTAIIGFSEFLQSSYRGTFDARAEDCINEIEKGGHKMLSLMEDLLVLAKVGKLESPGEPTNTNQVVQEVLDELSKNYAGVEEVIRFALLPEILIPDTLLSQLFLNLLGNALQYAGGAEQTIEVGGERNGRRVTFFVRDHGPGIPIEERGRIFEVFFRGAGGKQSKGTGIGLAIVHKIAELYGGRVWLEDTPGGGSTFRVELCEDEPSLAGG